jgi:hypothetical protein
MELEAATGDRGVRGGWEWIGRSGAGTSGSVSREIALLCDLWQGPWSARGSARLNRRAGSDWINLFARVDRRFEWLRRYRLTGYLALGDRAAFETAEQIEIGLELSF